MHRPLMSAVRATVLYADIFSYPLRGDELSRWLIQRKNMVSDTDTIPGIVTSRIRKMHWWYVKGRRTTVSIRRSRERVSKKKLSIAQKVCRALRFIPTIQFIGITGGLAMKNASRSDDIDLCIITTAGCVWWTRLLTVAIVSLVSHRRKPHDTDVTNMICLNMFLSETALRIPKSEQDLYIAHEVLQMEPVYNRFDTYARFLMANEWVRNYLPNAWDYRFNQVLKMPHKVREKLMVHFVTFIAVLIDPFVRWLQLWYMRAKRTSEIVSEDVIRFHPRDMRHIVYSELKARYKHFGIPLDKKLWRS